MSTPPRVTDKGMFGRVIRRGYSIFSLEELSSIVFNAPRRQGQLQPIKPEAKELEQIQRDSGQRYRQQRADGERPRHRRDDVLRHDAQGREERRERSMHQAEGTTRERMQPREEEKRVFNRRERMQPREEEERVFSRPPLTFLEGGIPEWLCEQMREHNLEHPTPIQRTLLHAMIRLYPRDALVHGETGSGKSLGYLLAALGGYSAEKRLAMVPTFNPHTLIIVPGAILASQLAKWALALMPDDSALLRVAVSEGDADRFDKTLLEPSPSHLLIATPGALHAALQAGRFNPTRLRRVIIDEVDSMLPEVERRADSWHRHPSPFLDSIQAIRKQRERLALPGHVQTIAVSATLCPRTRHRVRHLGLVESDVLVERKPKVGERKPLNDLALPAGIQHWYRRCEGGDLPQEIARLIGRWHDGEAGLIVMGAGESKRELQLALETWECPTRLLSRTTEIPEGKILIGSHVDARGLDIPHLKWILMIGLPPTMQEYVHLAGRVGRMGRTGHAYTLLLDDRQVERHATLMARLGLNASPVPQA